MACFKLSVEGGLSDGAATRAKASFVESVTAAGAFDLIRSSSLGRKMPL